MKTHVEELSPVQRKLTVDLPVERVTEALEDVYRKVQKTAKLKGFRAGKVPRHLLEKYFRQETASAAIEALVQATYPEAIKQANLSPISRPHMAPGRFAADQPFTYTATFEIRPTVTLSTYTGFTLHRTEFTVTDDEVEQQLKVAQRSMTRLVPVLDDAVLDGMMVARIDFEGTANGRPFEGSKATDYVVDMGERNILAPFAEQIRGMKVTEERTIQFPYPDDYYNVNLAGATATFRVALKELKRKEMPELNDEFAKDLGNFQTLADVRSEIRKRLEGGKERQAKNELATHAMGQLLALHPFDVPQTMVGLELEAMWRELERRAKAQGKTPADIGMTPEQYVKEYEATARDRVRGYLILDAIGEAERVDVTEAEVETRLQEVAQAMNQPVPKVRLHYEQNNLFPALRREMIHEKALDFIIEKSKIKIEKAKTEEKKATGS